MNHLIPISLTILLCFVYQSCGQNCGQQENGIDGTVKQVLLMNNDIPLPVNASLMTEWCSPFKTLSRRVSKFSKCMPPFLAQVVVVLGSGIKKPASYICKANKAKAIENYACMTTKYLERFNRREAFFLDSLQIISKNVSDDQILPHFCCAVNTLLHDIYSLERPKCKNPSVNTNNFIGDMVSLAVSDVLDLMCGTFRSHKQCQEKAPHALKFLASKGVDSVDLTKYSFVASILKVVGRLS